MATLKNTIINDNGYLGLPTGSTAQRPVSPQIGYTRYNTTDSIFEIYNGSDWKEFKYKTAGIEFLMVAGGGGGGQNAGAGGGAGGLITGSLDITIGNTYSISIGSGGSGGIESTDNTTAVNGNDTTIFSKTTLGGGAGTNSGGNGNSGGSGGGGGDGFTAPNILGGTGLQPGSTDGGFGNDGGDGNFAGGVDRASAGGGGAGGAGQSAPSTSLGGAGGIGIQSNITGTLTYYAGGGAGAAHLGTTRASGGLGGGGDSGVGSFSGGSPSTGIAGTTNTGGGGGAGGGGGFNGAAGGSGIVVLRYPSTLTITLSSGASTPSSEGEQTDGSNKYIRIITSGAVTFT